MVNLDLEYAGLADAAASHGGKLYIHGGGITKLSVPTLPFAVPMLALVIILKPGEKDYGRARNLAIRFVNPDGVDMMPPDPSPMKVGPRPELLEGEDSFIHLILNFAAIPLLRTGLHRLVIEIDGVEARVLALPVVLTEPMSET